LQFADAAAIAEFAERMNPRQRRLQSGACAHVADTWRRMEAYLNAEIARLRAAMEAHVAADARLAQDARLLRSIPGIGADTASPAQPHRSMNQSKPPPPLKTRGLT